jgi:hypothetical protein
MPRQNHIKCYWGRDLGNEKNKKVYGDTLPPFACRAVIRLRVPGESGVIATCKKPAHRAAEEHFVPLAQADSAKAIVDWAQGVSIKG